MGTELIYFRERKKSRLLLPFFFLCLFYNSSVFGQSLGKLIESTLNSDAPFTIRVFGTEDGIPQHQISTMISGKTGNMVIATANGLVEFNGQSFTDINPTDESRKILCVELYLDQKTNQLYGLNNKSVFYQISPVTKCISKDFLHASFYRDSIIYVRKNGDIRIARIGESKNRFISKKPQKEDVSSIGVIDGKVFYSNESGTYLFSRGNWIQLSTEAYYRSKTDPYTGKVYLLGTNHIAVYKQEKLFIEKVDDAQSGYFFTDMAFSPQGETFLSSHKGILYKNRKHPVFHPLSSNLPSKVILSLFFSKDENVLFAGSNDKGLMQLKQKHCVTFFDESVLKESSLSSIIKYNNHLLISGSFSTIFDFKQPHFTPYFNHPASFSCLSKINNDLWAGTWGEGILILKNRQPIGRIGLEALPSPVVHSIFQDRKRRIWIGTEDGIAFGETKKNIRPVFRSLKMGLIICFKQMKNGNILVGGEHGFYIFSEDLELIRQFSIRNGLNGKEVRCFYEKKDGTLLIGTYGGGLYYWNNKHLLPLNRMKNCLLDNDIFTLAPDKKGNLYISSNHGLYVINEQNIEDFIAQRINFLVPFRLGQDDGILNTECNGGFQNNYYTEDQKHFYFPTIQGILTSFFEIPKYRKLKPFLKEVIVNDEIRKLTDHVFPRNTHTINIQFYCPNFTPFYNLHYQYKLVGPDIREEWSSPTKHGTISFKMLPPGEYKVYMRGIDGFNDQHPNEVVYGFKIEKHIYETLWFRLLAFGLVFLLIFLLTYKRIQVSKDQELKDSEHRNTMFELKLKAIQAKMNPHFIFNCLNNIQYLIVMGKQEEAEYALSDFSILLRKFLQQSDNSFITLREEIELLKSYISVERFRFEESLEVEVDIPESLLHLKIPTLLIQPTVENAIVHGLTHKKGQKKLIIEGHLEDDLIILRIEDNGIGRQEAKRINTYRANHISHGWNMVLDKINLLKAKYQYYVIFEIIDKPENSGTTVIFKIPLIHDDMIEN